VPLRAAVTLIAVFLVHLRAQAIDAPDAKGPIRHVVLFKWKDGAPAADIEKAIQEFDRLPSKIPGIIGFERGVDSSPEGLARGFTHAFIVSFVDAAARDTYLPHAEHKGFVEKALPLIAEVLVVDFVPQAGAPGLRVEKGLAPHQVFQRDENNRAVVAFSGSSAADGPVEARVLLGGKPLDGLDWKEAGRASSGKFEARMQGVPAGGPYGVEVRAGGSGVTAVDDILVGDLWILAGQSNMEGVGNLENAPAPDARVHVFSMAHEWKLASEPLHWLIDSPDPVHSGAGIRDMDEAGRKAARAAARKDRKKGAGLGLPFAKELVSRTGIPIGLIASAHGGTSMAQWDPAGRDRGGETLYGSMHRQVQAAGGKVKGVLWYQGESDANPKDAPLYAERMGALVKAFRDDFRAPDLPFLMVQLGRFATESARGDWNTIQELQRLVPDSVKGVSVVPAVDLPLDDPIHIGTTGLERLGKRLARVAHREVHGASRIGPGPRLESVRVLEGRRAIEVAYSGVNGRLRPGEGILGFSIAAEDGKDLPIIYAARTARGNPSAVILELGAPAPETARLWYGRGMNPAVNLADEEDMAAPVFGPAPLDGKVAP